MNVPATLNLIPKLVNDMWNRLRQLYEQVAIVINGNIEFGNPTSGPSNIRGNWASVTTPVAPNTDFTVTHNLGRPAVGYLVMTADRAVDIYTSPTANAAPNTTIILRSNAASAVITLFIL